MRLNDLLTVELNNEKHLRVAFLKSKLISFIKNTFEHLLYHMNEVGEFSIK